MGLACTNGLWIAAPTCVFLLNQSKNAKAASFCNIVCTCMHESLSCSYLIFSTSSNSNSNNNNYNNSNFWWICDFCRRWAWWLKKACIVVNPFHGGLHDKPARPWGLSHQRITFYFFLLLIGLGLELPWPNFCSATLHFITISINLF